MLAKNWLKVSWILVRVRRMFPFRRIGGRRGVACDTPLTRVLRSFSTRRRVSVYPVLGPGGVPCVPGTCCTSLIPSRAARPSGALVFPLFLPPLGATGLIQAWNSTRSRGLLLTLVFDQYRANAYMLWWESYGGGCCPFCGGRTWKTSLVDPENTLTEGGAGVQRLV